MFTKIILLINFSLIIKVNSVHLEAYVSQSGLHGEFHFMPTDGRQIKIDARLETTLQYPEQIWSWGIHEFPVDYSNPDPESRCSDASLGKQTILFDDDLGYLNVPGNESFTLETDTRLAGKNGMWGKSILLWNSETNLKVCATISAKQTSLEHLAEARFHHGLAGSVYFRWLSSKETNHKDTLIYSNLFHTRNVSRKLTQTHFTEHSWKIYVTDIFDTDHSRPEDNCDYLQLVFDPQNRGKGNAIGDIDLRQGKIRVAVDSKIQESKLLYRDDQLVLLPSDLAGPQRRLYLVIFDTARPNDFLACAKIRHVQEKIVKATINANGIKGELTIKQQSRFQPTWLNFSISSASDDHEHNLNYAREVSSFRITELPPAPSQANKENYCDTGKLVFNPMNIDITKIPPPGFGTQEQYPIGDLSGKLQSRNKYQTHDYFLPGASSELSGIYWDVFLPLEGTNSIFHRGFSIQKFNRIDPSNIKESIWGCGTFARYEKNGIYQVPMFTAQILYRYPIVGRILLRQPKEEPWEDTAVIFEYLIHADGSTQNNSESHRWAIHQEPPGRDFYNWSERCISAGPVFNPYKVTFNSKAPEEKCNPSSPELCRLGDLWNRLGTLSIAGAKKDSLMRSRKMFIDRNLPLIGHNNILGKSLVIYDDFGPKARGERLACSRIGGHFQRKTVAKDWHSNGGPLSVTGQIEMVQQSEYELTNVEVDFKGLIENSGYHVHITPVEGDLEFPCEGSTLYGHWNPRNVNPKLSPLPAQGTTDSYEMGDLSGKFGTLDGYTDYKTYYNDTSLPLFGYESVIGRSIVIHKKEKSLRWACSSLERGYSPSEAREIRAIASFHHPGGYAYGYLRMTQLISYDGSQSDTIIEVKLRHPGKNDRNVTRNHHWQIFVNSVGVDATVPQTATRCVAGGYVWNPYYTQLADPLNGDLYREECGPDNPLRCYVGDVSSRLDTFDIGDKRAVFTDSNFPLEGDQSAIGRSIVIMGPERSSERFACANIEPDHDIVKYINLQKPPRFVVAQFLDDVRHVMGLPEWMLEIDSRKTKTLHNGACVQMLVHFKGPKAHQIELDLTRLLASGRLDSPTIYIPGYINTKRKTTLSYKTCGVRDPNEKSKKKNFFSSNAQTKLQINNYQIFLLFILINYLNKYHK